MKLKVIIVCFQFIFFTQIVKNWFVNALYDEKDSVIELNANNFVENVYNQNRLTLVNFYLDWCPHCIAFSQIWKQFAENIRDWNSVVRIGAINCAQEINSDLCKTFQITRFPRIRLFGLNAGSDDLGIHFEVRQSMEKMRTELIDYILKIHQTFPFDLNIFPISITSRNELLNSLPIELEKLNLIFLEKDPTYLAVQVFNKIDKS